MLFVSSIGHVNFFVVLYSFEDKDRLLINLVGHEVMFEISLYIKLNSILK